MASWRRGRGSKVPKMEGVWHVAGAWSRGNCGLRDSCGHKCLVVGCPRDSRVKPASRLLG